MKKAKPENFYATTERMLYDYNKLKSFAENLEERLDELRAADNMAQLMLAIGEENYNKIKTPNRKTEFELCIDPNTIRSSGINKTIEKFAVKKATEEQILEIQLYREKRALNKIDRAINNLTPLHKIVIEDFYINRIGTNNILDKIHLEERQFRNKKREAVMAISIELFGYEAMSQQEPLLRYINI
jgi:hypothetical protein